MSVGAPVSPDVVKLTNRVWSPIYNALEMLCGRKKQIITDLHDLKVRGTFANLTACESTHLSELWQKLYIYALCSKIQYFKPKNESVAKTRNICKIEFEFAHLLLRVETSSNVLHLFKDLFLSASVSGFGIKQLYSFRTFFLIYNDCNY